LIQNPGSILTQKIFGSEQKLSEICESPVEVKLTDRTHNSRLKLVDNDSHSDRSSKGSFRNNKNVDLDADFDKLRNKRAVRKLEGDFSLLPPDKKNSRKIQDEA
jgi:hypothetical protein